MTEHADEGEREQPRVGAEGRPQQASPGSDEQQEDLLALLQRERADFVNYRRRVSQERGEERERARTDLLAELLPLLDDLDRALTKAPEELAGHPWTRGVLLGRGRLRDFLARAGVEPIGTEGEPFDPTVHEALFYEERPGLADRRVATVIRPGYRMGGRVLRPAQVGVVGPGGDEPSRTDDQAGGEDRVVGNGA